MKIEVAQASAIQARAWTHHQLEPQNSIAAEGLHLRGRLDLETLRRGMEISAARHPILRTMLAWTDGGLEQRIAEPASLEIVMVDLRGRPGSAALARASSEARRPFDAAGPLWRSILITLQEAEHLLVLSAHPAILDL